VSHENNAISFSRNDAVGCKYKGWYPGAACSVSKQIDSLDQRIVELFQERARVVEEVGNLKREAHLPVTAPSREQQVVEKAEELAKGGPLPAEAVGRIYQKLVEEMRNWEASTSSRQ
jgi:chorismate mutase